MICLGENFKIDSDGVQFILYRKAKPKDEGKEGKFYVVGYYNTLKMALNGYARNAQLETFELNDDLNKIVEKLEEIKVTIQKVAEVKL